MGLECVFGTTFMINFIHTILLIILVHHCGHRVPAALVCHAPDAGGYPLAPGLGVRLRLPLHHLVMIRGPHDVLLQRLLPASCTEFLAGNSFILYLYWGGQFTHHEDRVVESDALYPGEGQGQGLHEHPAPLVVPVVQLLVTLVTVIHAEQLLGALYDLVIHRPASRHHIPLQHFTLWFWYGDVERSNILVRYHLPSCCWCRRSWRTHGPISPPWG